MKRLMLAVCVAKVTAALCLITVLCLAAFPVSLSAQASVAAQINNSSFSSTIVILHRPSSPAHVAGFVVAVVVDAVQRQGRIWLRSDVCEKRGEVVQPLIAHSDAASAVVFPLLKRRVGASFSRIHPRPMFWSASESVNEIAFNRPLFHHFSTQASARLRMAALQRTALNLRHGRSTVADRAPRRHPERCSGTSSDGQAPVAFSSSIMQSRHMETLCHV